MSANNVTPDLNNESWLSAWRERKYGNQCLYAAFSNRAGSVSLAPLSVFLASLLLTSCGGGGDSGVTPGSNINSVSDDSDMPGQDDGVVTEGTLFPGSGPAVDPASTRDEVASRADLLLIEYRALMTEVLNQMNEVYQDISNGFDDSPYLDNDILFVDTVNSRCDPQFDSNGTMTGLLNCNNTNAKFAFRHPLYSDVKVLVPDYTQDADFEIGDETSLAIWDESLLSSGGTENSARISTSTLSYYSQDEPNIELDIPAYGLSDTNCEVYLSPTIFPEENLAVNKCSKRLQDVITVLQRLNDRS